MEKRIGRLVTPGSKLQVNVGEKIRVEVAFTYQGPAWRETLYGALYKRVAGAVDEVSGGAGSLGWDISKADTPSPVTGCYVLVPVPNRPGETFGIYAKLGNVLSLYYDDVIEVLGAGAPVVTNFRITSYAKQA